MTPTSGSKDRKETYRSQGHGVKKQMLPFCCGESSSVGNFILKFIA
jgi:hypothetical protein